MEIKNKILLIECCNFDDFPAGGQLSFAKHLASVFNNEIALVGISTDPDEPIGKWFKKKINWIEYDFFAIYYKKKNSKRPVIPFRLQNWFALKIHRKKIQTIHFSNVLIGAPEVLFAVSNWNYPNICFIFSGTENPLVISRYKIGKLLAFLFDWFFFPRITKVNTILAAGNKEAIQNLVKRSKNLLKFENITQFPTRFDSAIFKKHDNRQSFRKKLNFSNNEIIVITTGRLAWFKGWKFMIDSFFEFQKTVPNSKFFIIGDGEDLQIIIEYIKILKVESSIFLTGYLSHNEISEYQNASDLFIMGSYKEGWSTTLVEAIACGLPCCVTNFSSAKEIIQQGINGYVVECHDTNLFAEAMNHAILLNREILPNEEIKRYALSELKGELLKHWKLI